MIKSGRLCSRCHARKPLSKFPRKKNSYCLLCREKKRAHYWGNLERERSARKIHRRRNYIRHGETSRRTSRLWKHKNRKRLRSYDMGYYHRTKQKRAPLLQAAARKYWKRHGKERGEYARNYRKTHRAEVALAQQRRRATLKNLSCVDFTKQQWEEKKRLYKNRCAYCGKRRKLTMDHVIPISQSGPHTDSNIVPACKSCNSRKHTKSVAEFNHIST